MGVVTKVLKLRRGNKSEYYALYLPKSVYELIGRPIAFEFRLEKDKLVLKPLNEAEYEEWKKEKECKQEVVDA